MTKAQQYAAAARSFLTTVAAVLVGLLGLSALPGVNIPASWIAAGGIVVGLVRTAIAALDSAMPLFGRGTPSEDLYVGDDGPVLDPQPLDPDAVIADVSVIDGQIDE